MTNKRKYPPLPWFALLIAIIPAIWFSYDRISLILNSDLQTAEIISCGQSWGYSDGSGRSPMGGQGGYGTYYAPIALTKQGKEVKATRKWASRKWCEKRIGSEVTVLIHNETHSKSRINSFFQLWLLPTFVLGTLVLMLCVGRFDSRRITPSLTVIWIGIFIYQFIVNFFVLI